MNKPKFLAILVLCLTTFSVHADPVDSPRDRGARPQLRDRIIRIIRVITNGDALTPPIPSPKP